MNHLDQHHLAMVVDPLDITLAWLSQANGYALCRELEAEKAFVAPDLKTSAFARFTTEVAGD